MTRPPSRAVFDTNVFVAAGFNPRSSAAELVRQAGQGRIEIVWNDATLREIRRILERIPRLDWNRIAPLFREGGRHSGTLPTGPFEDIADPDDRKFAALAAATGAVLVTNDDHLLTHRGRKEPVIATPSDYLQQIRSDEDAGAS